MIRLLSFDTFMILFSILNHQNQWRRGSGQSQHHERHTHHAVGLFSPSRSRSCSICWATLPRWEAMLLRSLGSTSSRMELTSWMSCSLKASLDICRRMILWRRMLSRSSVISWREPMWLGSLEIAWTSSAVSLYSLSRLSSSAPQSCFSLSLRSAGLSLNLRKAITFEQQLISRASFLMRWQKMEQAVIFLKISQQLSDFQRQGSRPMMFSGSSPVLPLGESSFSAMKRWKAFQELVSISMRMFSLSALAFSSSSCGLSSPSGVASVIFLSFSCSCLTSASIFVSVETQKSLLLRSTSPRCSPGTAFERCSRLQSANRLCSITSQRVDSGPLIFLRASKQRRKLSLMALSVSFLFSGGWLSASDFMSSLMRKRRASSMSPGCLTRLLLSFWFSSRESGSLAEKTLFSTIFSAISRFFSLSPPTSSSAACMLPTSSLFRILSMVGWLGAVEKAQRRAGEARRSGARRRQEAERTARMPTSALIIQYRRITQASRSIIQLPPSRKNCIPKDPLYSSEQFFQQAFFLLKSSSDSGVSMGASQALAVLALQYQGQIHSQPGWYTVGDISSSPCSAKVTQAGPVSRFAQRLKKLRALRRRWSSRRRKRGLRGTQAMREFSRWNLQKGTSCPTKTSSKDRQSSSTSPLKMQQLVSKQKPPCQQSTSSRRISEIIAILSLGLRLSNSNSARISSQVSGKFSRVMSALVHSRCSQVGQRLFEWSISCCLKAGISAPPIHTWWILLGISLGRWRRFCSPSNSEPLLSTKKPASGPLMRSQYSSSASHHSCASCFSAYSGRLASAVRSAAIATTSSLRQTRRRGSSFPWLSARFTWNFISVSSQRSLTVFCICSSVLKAISRLKYRPQASWRSNCATKRQEQMLKARKLRAIYFKLCSRSSVDCRRKRRSGLGSMVVSPILAVRKAAQTFLSVNCSAIWLRVSSERNFSSQSRSTPTAEGSQYLVVALCRLSPSHSLALTTFTSGSAEYSSICWLSPSAKKTACQFLKASFSKAARLWWMRSLQPAGGRALSDMMQRHTSRGQLKDFSSQLLPSAFTISRKRLLAWASPRVWNLATSISCGRMAIMSTFRTFVLPSSQKSVCLSASRKWAILGQTQSVRMKEPSLRLISSSLQSRQYSRAVFQQWLRKLSRLQRKSCMVSVLSQLYQPKLWKASQARRLRRSTSTISAKTSPSSLESGLAISSPTSNHFIQEGPPSANSSTSGAPPPQQRTIDSSSSFCRVARSELRVASIQSNFSAKTMESSLAETPPCSRRRAMRRSQATGMWNWLLCLAFLMSSVVAGESQSQALIRSTTRTSQPLAVATAIWCRATTASTIGSPSSPPSPHSTHRIFGNGWGASSDMRISVAVVGAVL